ncbi:MAG: hypothetical protein ACK56E_15630 [Planctomyces sp.]
MPGFISVLASGVVHLIVILFMVWSAGQMLDSGVQKVKERLDEKSLLAAAKLLLLPEPQPPAAEEERTPEPADQKPAEVPEPTPLPPAEKPAEQTTAAAEPADRGNEIPQTPPEQLPQPTETPETALKPVEYNGLPLTGESDKYDPMLDAIYELGLVNGHDGPLHVEAPFGQQSSHVKLDGQNAPVLKVSFGSGVLEHLLESGAATVVCLVPESELKLQLRGTLSKPRSWGAVDQSTSERMSIRNTVVPEHRYITAEARLRLEEMGLTPRECSAATLKIWFSNELDQYLLKTQLNVVRDQPETEWMKLQTHIHLVLQNGEVVARGRLSGR